MNNKNLYIIIIITVLILSGCSKKINNNNGKDVTPVIQKEVELYNKKLITQDSYVIGDIIKNFSYSMEPNILAFTENEYVKLDTISQTSVDNSIMLDVYNDEKTKFIKVNYNYETLSLDDLITQYVTKEEYIVEKGDNEVIITKDDTYIKRYIYVTKNNIGTIKAEYFYSKSKENTSKEEAVKLIKKGLGCLSTENLPYIYDMATFLKLPLKKKVNSFHNINQIYNNGIQIVTNSLNSEKWEIYYINIYYELKDNVTLENVSTNPKIDKFLYKPDDSNTNKTFFRIYEEDETYDVLVSASDYLGRDENVNDVEELINAVNAIDNK